MKKVLKNNLFLIISILILLIWAIFGAIECSNAVDFLINTYEENYIRCQDENFLYSSEQSVELCKIFTSETIQKPSAGFVFFYILITTNVFYIQIIAPLFIIIPASYRFFKRYKSGMYKNMLMREKYSTFLKKELLHSYKTLIIFPIFLIFIFIISYLLTGNFDGDFTVKNYYYMFLPMERIYIIHFLPFLLLYFWNMIVNSAFYVHLSLIYAKKTSNFAISVVLSYITYLLIDIVAEGLIGRFFFKTGIFEGVTALLVVTLCNYWAYDGINTVPSLVFLCAFYLLLAIISFIILRKMFSKKESVVLESEKQ